MVIAATTSDMPPTWEGELEPGDVIHAVNRTTVRNLDALRLTIDALKPGDPLVLQIERDGELMYVAGRAE